MAELLFISPEEITSTTILGGNVDVDNYVFCIANVQITTIEPLLGSKLYEKIISDIEGDVLDGKYLEMFERFVKPITKNEALAQYIEIASYKVTNGGIYKHVGENMEVVPKDEVLYLSNKYSGLAQMYVQRFEKWICNASIPEYRDYTTGEVNSVNDISLTAGWKLGTSRHLPWYLQED